MAFLTMPLTENYPWYSFTCTLEGATYTIECAFNTRANRWYMTLGDAVGNIIVAGVPLLIERDLLAAYRYLPIPPGNFVALDNSGQGQEPTLGSFLLDHVLLYVEKGTL